MRDPDTSIAAKLTDLAAIVDHIPALVSYVDTEQRYRFANALYGEWFGIDRAKIPGMHMRELLGAEVYSSVNEHIRSALAGNPVHCEVEASIGNHGPRWCEVRFVPDSHDGEVRGFFTLVTDITEKKRSEQELRNTSDRDRSLVRALLDTSVEGIITIDVKGRIETMNSAALSMFGYGEGEIHGENVSIIMPSPFKDEHDEYLSRYLATGERRIIGIGREVSARRKDGTVFPVDLSVSEFHWDHQLRFAGFVRDITERKEAERRLGAQFAVTQALAEAATIEEVTPNLLQSICSGVGCHLGELWTLDEAGEVMRRAGSFSDPALDAAEFETHSHGVTFGRGAGLVGGVWEAGTPAWMSDVVVEDGFMRSEVAARAGLHGAFAFPLKAGDTTLGVMAFFSRDVCPHDQERMELLMTLGNQVGGFLERKKIEHELRQAQKMEAVGRLAGGIAHDFNNLLMGVIGCCRIASSRLQDTHPARALVNDISAEAERGVGLTRQLLTFSRKRRLSRAPFALNDMVNQAMRMVPHLVGEDVAIELELTPTGGRVMADSAQIEQVLVNLVVNARDAMPSGGELIITTADVELGEDAHRELRPGRYVALTVRDTGVGMDAATRDRIFEPFFTTKGVGEGTGLGLSTAYGIVKQHRGYIDVDSAPGRGTTLTVYLPRSDEESPAPVDDQTPRPSIGGAETILIVEDEALVRTAVRYGLESRGFRVLEAKNSKEAQHVLQERGDDIDLLLTDVVLPDFPGPELARQAEVTHPKIPALFMSAYPNEYLIEQGKLRAGQPSLEKPFTEDELAARVRAMLDRSGAE